MTRRDVDCSLESLGTIKVTRGTTVEDLVAFAVKIESFVRLNDTNNCLAKFRQGRVLVAAKARFSAKGGWRRYIESQGISAMSDSRARRLAERAKSEKQLAGLTLSEAYRKFLQPVTTRKKPKKTVVDAPTPPRERIEPREEELTALQVFLSVVGSWERARDLLAAGEELLPKHESSPETQEEAMV